LKPVLLISEPAVKTDFMKTRLALTNISASSFSPVFNFILAKAKLSSPQRKQFWAVIDLYSVNKQPTLPNV